MDSWKKYASEPLFLRVLLPGLEMAHAKLTDEIANVKEAISKLEKGGGSIPILLVNGHAATPHELPEERPLTPKEISDTVKSLPPVKVKRAYVKKAAVVEKAPLTSAEMFNEVIKLKGGTATNDDFRDFIKKNKNAPRNLLNHKNLSVAVSYAVNKSKQLTRVDMGTYQLTA